MRAIPAGLLCLLLAACTGAGGEPDAPDPPAAPALRLPVASVPLNCQPVPGAGAGCQVGGAGVADGLGRVRVYHEVRLGQPAAGGCRAASIAGSLNAAAWSVPFTGGGEWCGRSAAFTYRLGGRPGGQGRLEYRHDPPAPASETFTGTLPAPPTGTAARDPGDRRGFVAVYPQGLSIGAGQPFWASSGRVELGIDELRFTADLLDDLQARLCVDPAQVAAAGHSAGGGVTARVACELAGRVAAVATVAAALFTEPVECRPARAVPVLSLHGTADEVLPYGGQPASVASPLPLPALPAWLAEWATRDGCPGDPAAFLDTAEVSGFRWTGCRDGAEVVHYRLNGGGHDLPLTVAGRPIAQVLWDFFAAHPIPG